MGAAGPHPVSLNISNGFRWGKGPGQVGMGQWALRHPWFLYGSLYTSSQPRERGLEAEFKHWGGGAFPGLPPTKAHTHPQSKEVANGGEHLQATHLESQFNRWEVTNHGYLQTRAPATPPKGHLQVTPVQSQTPSLLS